MKFAVFALLASSQAIQLNRSKDDVGVTHYDPWVRMVVAANVNPVPMGGRATSPDGNYTNPSINGYASDWVVGASLASQDDQDDYEEKEQKLNFAQLEDPIEEYHPQMLAQGNKWTNQPNTNWAPPNYGFSGNPERVHVLDPVAYQSRANTPSYLGNRRTTFYAQSDSDSNPRNKNWNNWPNTNWAPPNYGFQGNPERVHVLDPVAYQSRANTPSYLGNRRTTFYAQGDDQPEGTNQGVNQLIVPQKDKRWQENSFRKAFPPKNNSVPQWNPKKSLAQGKGWGDVDVDSLHYNNPSQQAFAHEATKAGKYASWHKPFAQP